MHSGTARTPIPPRSGQGRYRRTGVATVLALVATVLATVFTPGVASAAPVTSTFQEGVASYSGTTDATLSQATPDTPNGTDDRLEIIEGDPDPESLRGLIRFDLSSIEPGSTISGTSTITFTVADPGQDVAAYAVNRGWDEAEATWNEAESGTAWNTPGTGGTDRSGTAMGTIDMSGAIGDTTTLTIPNPVVQGWVNDPTTNHGIAIISTDNNDAAALYSSERFDSAQRPLLSITHEDPTPVEITTTSPLTAGAEDAAYSVTFAATGGTSPYTWAVTSGGIPAGLTLSAAGVLSGTPTETGTFNFGVTATDTYGVNADTEAFSLEIAAPAATGGAFVGITPARALDTRQPGQTPCVSGAAGRELVVAPKGAVPADATAVSLNVTVVGAKAPGYLTVYPKGTARPTASNLNYVTGQTVPNRVVTKVGTGGAIVLYASGGCPNVVVDIAGYFTAGTTGAGGFEGITPARALDTRQTGQTPCVSGAAGRELVVAPKGTVPADASAVVLNVTVVGAKAPGYLTVYPKGSARPTASNLNYVAGQTVPNQVTAKVGTGGAIVLYASGGCPNVVVDIAGYHTAGPADPGGFEGITPARALDTRQPGQTPCVSGAAGRELVVAPKGTVPADASAVVLNVTVVGAKAPGYLTVYPKGSARPTASNLNYVQDLPVPNAVATKVGTGGAIVLYASGGCPNVVVDIVGYHTAN